MKQTWRIFCKDIRHFWLHISILVLLTAAFTVFDILQSPLFEPGRERINTTAGFLKVAVPLCWWYLIALLIQEEALPGDRQFWLTRPYEWKSLLAAKTIFVLTLVNLTLLISSCFVLDLQGFPVVSNLPALLLAQIPTSTFLIMPAVLLASITDRLGHFVFAWFLIGIALILPSFFAQTNMGYPVVTVEANDQVLGFFLFLMAVTVLTFWQYAMRRTQQTRIALAVVVAVMLIPSSPSLREKEISRVQEIFSVRRADVKQQLEISHIDLAYDLTRSSAVSKPKPGTMPGWVALEMPVKIVGVPSEVSFEGHSTDCKIELPDGRPGNIDWKPVAWLKRIGNEYWQEFNFKANEFNALTSVTVTLRSSMALTAITDRVATRFPVNQRSFTVPDLGICRVVDNSFGSYLVCNAGMREPQRTLVRIRYSGFQSEPAMTGSKFDSRYPLIWGLSPVTKWVVSFPRMEVSDNVLQAALEHPDAELEFVPQYPLLRFQKDLVGRNIRLSDYIASSRNGDSTFSIR